MIAANFRDANIEKSVMTERLQIISKRQKSEKESGKLRVAAYCRVSTDLEIQKKSLELQMEAFEKTIMEHPEWEIVKIYYDKGKTGTKVKGRSDFMRMIEDAKAGKIDLILTKSASRVARNTRDMLEYTRMLRDINVGFFFEEENINTLSMTSELLLTVYAAFSQEESHEISESMKLAIRNRFKMGVPMKSRVYGYTIDKEGNWEIVPEEAQVVRLVYNLMIEGYTPSQIAGLLTDECVPTRTGQVVEWKGSQILNLVKNEKYTGDCLMQKSYTADHLEHKCVRNTDLLVPQYYLQDHHEAIVSREDYNEVQKIVQLRFSQRGYNQYPYFGYLVCPICGAPLVSCRIHSVGSPKVWVCSGHGNAKRQGDRSQCKPYSIFESVIDSAFAEAIMKNPVTSHDRKTADELTDIRRRLKESDGVISYRYLRSLVESITFPDFDKMEVSWKDGMKTTVPMKYETVYQHPYPEEGEKLRGKTDFGGYMLDSQHFTSSSRGHKARRRFIQNLLITMPEPDDAIQVPCVKDGEKK